MPDIDPQTGERIGPPQIDPATGERIGAGPATGQTFNQTKAASPPNEAKASPGGIANWLGNAESDIRQGGSKTAIGRGLGYMQGRGDKGYTGMQSGVSPETAEFMGSPALGATRAAKGIAEVGSGHPVKGGIDTVAGAAQAATIPSLMVGGPAADLAMEAIPSAKYAGRTLEDIRNAAADVRVTPKETLDPLNRFQQLTQRGGATAKPATQLSNRLRSTMVPERGTQPFNFPEARDFYSNISNQSAEDVSRLNPIMRRQMGDVRAGLHQDLTDAAGTIGRGEDYAKAIKEYAQAKRIQNILKTSGKLAIPIAVGGGIAAKIGQRMIGK